MKTTLLALALFALLTGPALTQVYLSEDFSSGTFPPEGWTIEFYDGWSISETSQAGGLAPEALFSGVDGTGNNTRLVSPVIDLSGAADLTLSFKTAMEVAGGNANFLLQVRSAANSWPYSGGPWTHYTGENVDGHSVVFEFQGTNYEDLIGIWDFQFCFLIGAANIAVVNAWYLDDIMLYSGTVATEETSWTAIKKLFD